MSRANGTITVTTAAPPPPDVGSTESTLILTNKDGGSFEGSFQFHSPGPANVIVKSNLGGRASARVK